MIYEADLEDRPDLGINGMTLLDLIEMLCDWKAAGERHADGSMERSLMVNQERFHIGEQLQSILENTARELGFLTPAKALTTSRRQEMKMKKRFVLELSEEEAQTLCEALGDHAESDLERIGIESEGRWFLKKLVEKLNDWL